MGWDTGLADRIRAKGVRVVEVDGWRTRGSTTYEPLLGLWHHTAGAATGTVPSLATCVYGRPGLSGPLCQVLQSRDPDGDDIAYVIAAGRANHTGVGVWRGMSGNSKAFGVEVEHTGTSVQSSRRHEITARILAAGVEAGSRDARNVCRHAEYATPAGRKIDFAITAPPWTADGMRERVAYWIGREDDDMDEATLRRVVGEVVDEKLRLYQPRYAQATHSSLNRALDPDDGRGSVIRKALVELGERGIDEALREGHSLDVRLKALADEDPAPSVPPA